MLKARPVLAPFCDEFDAGRRVGLDMARRNVKRRRDLQKGIPGLVSRIFSGRAAAKARKDATPELP